MARTPSMTTNEAEAILGKRGNLHIDKLNRSTVAKWLTAQGFKALFVAGISYTELGLAYNDTSGAQVNKLRAKQAKADEIGATGDDLDDAMASTVANLQAERDRLKDELDGALALGMVRSQTTFNGSTVDSAAPGSVEAAIRALVDAAAPKAAPVDAEAVRKIVADWSVGFEERLQELKEQVKNQPIDGVTRHVVDLKSPEGTITRVDGLVHPNFPKLLKISQCRDASGYVPSMFLAGEASSGKTTATRKLAEALGLAWYFNGAITMPHEMLGFIDASGAYHTTPFREAYEKGGVYCFDEVDRSDPRALLAVNPHLANGEAFFPDGKVKRHKDCIIICTANTWGLGANAEYVGAAKLDGAFLSRFPIRIEWNIDEQFEQDICGNVAWARHVQAKRKYVREHGLKILIDVRCSIAGASLLANGFSEKEVAEMTYLANLSKAQKDQVACG